MRRALVAAIAAALAAAGTADARPVVYAAASLTGVLPRIQAATYQFAGSNQLAFQIGEGAPADVFVSASPKYVVQLRQAGLTIGPPSWFATDELVLIVPRSNPAHIRRAADVARRGVRLVLAAQGVPAGDYARRSLAGMHLERALANVVSDEPDVEGVVAKVALGEADAGFAYRSDAITRAQQVRVIPLPRKGHFVAVDGAIVVRGAPHLAEARAFVRSLSSKRARRLLRAAGFGPGRR